MGTVITAAACVTFFANTSYRLVPPAMRSLPSGRTAWPPQNRSLGVGIRWNVFVEGSQSNDLKVPALNDFRLFPDPAMMRTLPVYYSAAWIALIRRPAFA